MDRALGKDRLVTATLVLMLTVSCGRPEEVLPPIQVAPELCPPDPLTQETDLWTDWQRIPLPNGRTLELRGCRSDGDGRITFDYRGRAPRSRMHLVEYHLYEGGGWIVVDPGTGQVQPISGRPIFSPDASWFATGTVDLEAQYNRNHLDIWRVGADTIQRVFELNGDGEWGAEGLSWASDDTLEYQRIGRLDGLERDVWLDTTYMRAVWLGTRWELERN